LKYISASNKQLNPQVRKHQGLNHKENQMAAKRPQRKKKQAPAKVKVPEEKQEAPPPEPPLKQGKQQTPQMLRRLTISEIQGRQDLLELYREWKNMPFTQTILDAMWEAVRPIISPSPNLLACETLMAAYQNQNIGHSAVLKRLASLDDIDAEKLPNEQADYGAKEWLEKQKALLEGE
jgi:hypothetical protein